MFGKKKPEPAEEEIVIREKPEPVVEIKPVEEKKPVKPAGTFIAEGVTLVGNFQTDDDFEIKGTVRGIVVSSKPMHIDSTGALYGDAKVESLCIDGEVEGSVIVEKQSVISESGRMKGKLSTATFRTDPGSAFEGSLKLEVPKKAEPVIEEPVAEEAPAAQDYDAIFSAPAEPEAEKDRSSITLE